jgi:hypothetical protein
MEDRRGLFMGRILLYSQTQNLSWINDLAFWASITDKECVLIEGQVTFFQHTNGPNKLECLSSASLFQPRVTQHYLNGPICKFQRLWSVVNTVPGANLKSGTVWRNLKLCTILPANIKRSSLQKNKLKLFQNLFIGSVLGLAMKNLDMIGCADFST